jgi:hypothetical protein
MMLELKIRRGKGGHISSPTSTAGYVFQLVLMLAVGLLMGMGALHSKRASDSTLLLVVAVLGTLLFIHTRDLIAWLLATDAEREKFQHEVESAERFRSLGPRVSAPMDSRLLLVVATVMFGFMAFSLLERPLLVVIPVLGWLYVAIRVISERRRARR